MPIIILKNTFFNLLLICSFCIYFILWKTHTNQDLIVVLEEHHTTPSQLAS